MHEVRRNTLNGFASALVEPLPECSSGNPCAAMDYLRDMIAQIRPDPLHKDPQEHFLHVYIVVCQRKHAVLWCSPSEFHFEGCFSKQCQHQRHSQASNALCNGKIYTERTVIERCVWVGLSDHGSLIDCLFWSKAWNQYQYLQLLRTSRSFLNCHPRTLRWMPLSDKVLKHGATQTETKKGVPAILLNAEILHHLKHIECRKQCHLNSH